MAHNKKQDRNAKVIEMAGAKSSTGDWLYTYDEIGEMFGITKQRVQQILIAAGIELREPKKSEVKLNIHECGATCKLAK